MPGGGQRQLCAIVRALFVSRGRSIIELTDWLGISEVNFRRLHTRHRSWCGAQCWARRRRCLSVRQGGPGHRCLCQQSVPVSAGQSPPAVSRIVILLHSLACSSISTNGSVSIGGRQSRVTLRSDPPSSSFYYQIKRGNAFLPTESVSSKMHSCAFNIRCA